MNRPSPLWPALAALLLGGCERSPESDLVVATSWSEAECRAVASEFTHWSSQASEALDQPTRLRWVRLAPGEDPARFAGRLGAVDVLLGGSLASYRRLEGANVLANPEASGGPVWIESRRSRVGWISTPGNAGRIALSDPRRDPSTLALGQAAHQGDWAKGYASLLVQSARALPIGPGGGSALAAVAEGRASTAPGIAEDATPALRSSFSDDPSGAVRIEGSGMVRGARSPERAGAFLRFLATRHPNSSPRDEPGIAEGSIEGLLADLLGAAMAEAQEDQRAAFAALDRARRPEKLWADWLKLPPWPPASIQKMRAKPSGAELIETLADQIAPDPYDRAWLLELWERPAGRVDGPLLVELATVNGGRLGTNPRLRAWLREEWMAWARQNARRVAREAEKAKK